jgi:hypothetical protein
MLSDSLPTLLQHLMRISPRLIDKNEFLLALRSHVNQISHPQMDSTRQLHQIYHGDDSTICSG